MLFDKLVMYCEVLNSTKKISDLNAASYKGREPFNQPLIEYTITHWKKRETLYYKTSRDLAIGLQSPRVLNLRS